MNILLIHQAYAGQEQVGGTRHSELGRYLIGNGHNFSVIGSEVSYLTGKASRSEEADDSGIRFIGAKTYSGLHKSYFHRALSFISFMISSFWLGLKMNEIDLYWGTSPPLFQILPTWLLAKLFRKPFVFEVRDLWPAFPVDMGVLNNRLFIKLAESFELFFYRQADHLVINSPGFLDHLLNLGIREDKISIIPNGVDLKYFPENIDGSDFRRQHQLGNKLVVLYAGAHGLANDLEIILKAADKLRDRSDIEFVLVGDGKLKPGLQAEAEQMALTNICFIPPQPKSKIPNVLAAADLCLAILKDIPMFKTTYPNKVFDYMAAGRPTLLMIDGVIREVVENAGGGIFIPPGDPNALEDAVKLMANQPKRRVEMGLAARDYVGKHFSRSDQAEMVEKLFQELLSWD